MPSGGGLGHRQPGGVGLDGWPGGGGLLERLLLALGCDGADDDGWPSLEDLGGI